ncbi:allantoate deiminase [Silvibacterium bohemicum]|uniref:Allantoate deiminase n=1 Tax=Silvibacterium bohemicum TaxID=1577686 RepID=A0A841JZR2_9BACT|nr:allantoate amidohydrolase [Silvibacterium bohemicum]MBB6146135.1 allantoate deiminase [Silvibacterium bohemicum]
MKAIEASSTALVAKSFDALAAEIIARCAALSRFTEEPGRITRTFLSPAMEDCHRLVRRWMEETGMEVFVDRAGNLRGYYSAAEEREAPRIILASHLDTVPNAGRYDGILGVLLGLGVVEALNGLHLRCGIEVIGFSDEEGVRYGLPFIGSRALAGTLGPPQLARLDANGIRMAVALGDYAAAHPEAVEAALHPKTRGYLEFHIEQGPVLDESQLPMGVVDAIAGQSRAVVTFRGRAGHAGTTPMTLRRDALAAAAEWLVAVEAAGLAAPGLVATAGKIVAEPGAANVIPELCRCTLDVRHASDEIRTTALKQILASADAIAAGRQIAVEHTIEVDQAAVALNPALTALAEKAVLAAGHPAPRMISGAGHDAMILAAKTPAAMIFLRSPGGISHHPEESVLAEDVAAALRAGLNFLDLFENHLESESSCTT